jgi:CDP-paratose 2-epimerase
MKYLITGGCGFLGSNLGSHVLKNNEDLFVLDNLSREGSIQNLLWLQTLGNFKFYNADVRSFYDVSRVIKEVQPDFIFHLAGQVAMTSSIANPRLDFEINALGTFNVIDAVRNYSEHTCILYSSTNKVYGDLEWVKYDESETRYVASDFPNGFGENTPLNFQSPYGTSKGAADQYVLDAHKIFGIKTVVFRHSSMYGGRQFATYDQGWIGWFCQQAVLSKKVNFNHLFTISGNGKQVRDVLHAEDMISLYFSATRNMDKLAGQPFNVGGGMSNSLSLIELFNFLESNLDLNLKYKKLESRISDQRIFVADYSKIERLIGWIPNVDMKSGLVDMINWVEQNNK